MNGSVVKFVDRACKILGISKPPAERVTDVIFDPALNKGKMTLENCFRKYFGVPISDGQMKKLVNLWVNNWRPAEDVTSIIRSLKRLNYRLAVLSNSEATNCRFFSGKGWYGHFDALFLSHELGVAKPDLRIYEIALRKLKEKPGECLFIDDQEACLKTARKIGMRTILFTSAARLKKELAKIGIRL